MLQRYGVMGALVFLAFGLGMVTSGGENAAMAQAPAVPNLNLRGDRFKPLTYGQLTPPQKTLADNLLAGTRGGLNGPFNVLMRSPEMGDLIQKYGEYVRFRTSLSPALNELAIIMVGRHWTSQYEFYAHKDLAIKGGLSPAIVAAVAEGRRPSAMSPEETAIYNFTTEMLNTKQVSDAAFKAVIDKFGERGAVDLTGTIGYYGLVSAILNLDRYPLPAGATPLLKPLPSN